MIRRVGVLLVALALLQIAGGHWFSLQLVAWGRMLVDYSQSNGLTAGIRMTFDGEHPCPMCERIAESRESERRQKQDAVPGFDDLKPLLLGLPPSHRAAAFADERVPTPSPNSERSFRSHRDRPPVPPPRLFRAV